VPGAALHTVGRVLDQVAKAELRVGVARVQARAQLPGRVVAPLALRAGDDAGVADANPASLKRDAHAAPGFQASWLESHGHTVTP
jgi:hypothetical protein